MDAENEDRVNFRQVCPNCGHKATLSMTPDEARAFAGQFEAAAEGHMDAIDGRRFGALNHG